MLKNSGRMNKTETTKLGEGAYGCVIEPSVPCGKNTTNTSNHNNVSKILRIKNNKFKKSEEIYKNEFQIGKKFEAIDKNKIFFLGADELCKIEKKNITNEKVVEAISNCFKKKTGINREVFFNLTLKKGYDFKQIFYTIYSTENLYLSFAHLILGIKTLTAKTNMMMMDIKSGNLLFSIYQQKYLHPVFIDFSNDYIVGYKNTMEDYINSFKREKPSYFTWGPEIQASLMLKVNPNADVLKEILQLYSDFLLKIQETANISNVNSLDVYQFFYKGDNKDTKIAEDTEFSLKELQKQCKRKTVNKKYAQKMMLWQLSKVFIALIPHILVTFAREENKKEYLFYRLIMTMQHPNISKRLDCDTCLSYLDHILDYDKKNRRVDKYMISASPNMIKKIML